MKTLDEVISQTLAWESGKMGWMVMLGVVVDGDVGGGGGDGWRGEGRVKHIFGV